MSQVPSFIFGCPGCQKEFKVLAEFAGEVVQCPHCAQKIRIPASFFEELESDNPLTEETSEITFPPLSNATAPASIKAERQMPVQNRALPGSAKAPATSKTPPSKSESAETPKVGPGAPTRISKSLPSPKENAGKVTGRVTPTKGQEEKPSVDGKVNLPDADAGKVDPKPDSQKLSRPGSVGQPNLPPTFSSKLGSILSVDKADDPLPNHPGLPPIFSAAVVEAESHNPASATKGVVEPPTRSEENQIDSAIAAKLPPRFEAEDPTRVRTGRDQGSKVLLPTAEGGIQTVDQRTVTVEYQGQKYVLIAMTQEEKRRRAIISNALSILIAILAIALTIWFLI